MFPDPIGSWHKPGAQPASLAPQHSAVLAVLGLIWSAAFMGLYIFFDALEGIAGGQNTSQWSRVMWGIWGPQVIMGLSVLMGGRCLPWPARALFVLATLATLAQGLHVAVQKNGGSFHIPFMVISTMIAMIPQVIGWRLWKSRGNG